MLHGVRTMTNTSDTVRRTFDRIPATYDLLNHLLTFGLDAWWRRRAARAAAASEATHYLDMCTGTGVMARAVRRAAGPGVSITGADFCAPMIQEGEKTLDVPRTAFCLADAACLPFAAGTFGAATIAFALRNLNTTRDHLAGCMGELHRVLRPGGRLVTVETTQPPSPLARSVMRFYARRIVPIVGTAVSGSRPAYTYLSSTIPRFYGADEFADILRGAGFGDVRYTYLTMGIVAVHVATK